jgi:EAL domain-containing protein (putative c-di-GMP-specific phosphodiesterase class I)
VRALAGGGIVGASAVPCWDHPQRGPVRPETFGPAAERLGVAGTIRSWVPARAVAEAARWADGRYVSVPVTGDQLAEAYDVLTAGSLDGHRLVLELPGDDALTEDAALSRLRALGVRIAVTGFGTSYASLRALGHRPVDLLKLDDPTDAAEAGVAEAVIRLSQALGLATLIDGVEVPPDAVFHAK